MITVLMGPSKRYDPRGQNKTEPKMKPCKSCGSPTRSHIIGNVYLCHKCYLNYL